jgi:hypothetical protein
MRKAISIIFLICSGFLFFTATLSVFFQGLSPTGKLFVMGGFAVAALIPHLIGLAFGGFRYWRRDTGVVLLSVTGFTAFTLFTIVCMMSSEEFRRILPPDELQIFGSYYVGTAVTAACAVLGWLLLKSDRNVSVE